MSQEPVVQKKLTYMNQNITFIGAGNMARSLIIGLTHDNPAIKICVSDPDENQLDGIRKNWPKIKTTTNNQQAIQNSDVVILAVKPQIMKKVCEDLQLVAQQQSALYISIAAGIQQENIETWLGGNLPIVRCMPNTPALVQSSATALYANSKTSIEQKSLAESILRAVGITVWFDKENELNAITALSGSGPAYFFLMMEAMQKAAENLGIKTEDARLLTLQTAFGATKLALESTDSPAQLRQKVTSKGGTTEAAIGVLTTGNLVELFQEAIFAAKQRSEELGTKIQ